MRSQSHARDKARAGTAFEVPQERASPSWSAASARKAHARLRFQAPTFMRANHERFPDLAKLALDLELDELERLAAMLCDLMVEGGDGI